MFKLRLKFYVTLFICIFTISLAYADYPIIQKTYPLNKMNLTPVAVNFGKISQTTNDGENNFKPAVENGKIYWLKGSRLDGENHVYMQQTGGVISYDTKITSSVALRDTLKAKNGKVYWIEYADFKRKIYYSDGRIVSNIDTMGIEPYSFDVDNDGTVVFSGYDGTDTEIYVIKGSIITKLTNNSSEDMNPSISNGKIVWQGFDKNDFEIMYFDGEKIIQTTDNIYDDINPILKDGKIVWQGFDGNDYEIFYFIEDTIYQLTDNAYNELSPYLSGDNIVWSGDNGSNYDIYIWDGKNSLSYIERKNTKDINPKIAGNEIVWETESNFISEILYFNRYSYDLPVGGAQIIYTNEFRPYSYNTLSESKPMSVDNLSSGKFSMSIFLSRFKSDVDVYFGIFNPEFDDEIYLVDENMNITPASEGLKKFRVMTAGKDLALQIAKELSIRDLIRGNYNVYLLVVPANDTSFINYQLWQTNFVIEY